MSPSAVNAHETAAGAVARVFASGDFAVGLRVRHSCFDLVENLLFREAGIFQPRDLRIMNVS